MYCGPDLGLMLRAHGSNCRVPSSLLSMAYLVSRSFNSSTNNFDTSKHRTGCLEVAVVLSWLLKRRCLPRYNASPDAGLGLGLRMRGKGAEALRLADLKF